MDLTEKKEKEKFASQKKQAELKKQQELKYLEEEKRREEEATKILKAQEEKKEQENLEKKKAEETKKQIELNQDEVETSTSSDQPLNDSTDIQSSNSDFTEESTIKEPIVSSETEEQPKVNKSGWGAPLSTLFLTSSYGSRSDPTGFSGSFHDGIDLGGTSSTPILSSRAGTVVQSSFDGSAGNYAIIDHGDGYFSYYLHMSVISTSVGQTVSAGQTIGTMGTTGNSTGVHLHFGVATSQNWTGFIDPAPLLGL